MSVNLELLDEAIAWIEEHPEQHNQKRWMERTQCGTAYCLAGAIVMLAGWVGESWTEYGGTEFAICAKSPDGIIRRIPDAAHFVLGTTARSRERYIINQMYCEDNSLEDIKILRKELDELPHLQ